MIIVHHMFSSELEFMPIGSRKLAKNDFSFPARVRVFLGEFDFNQTSDNSTTSTYLSLNFLLCIHLFIIFLISLYLFLLLHGVALWEKILFPSNGSESSLIVHSLHNKNMSFHLFLLFSLSRLILLLHVGCTMGEDLCWEIYFCCIELERMNCVIGFGASTVAARCSGV